MVTALKCLSDDSSIFVTPVLVSLDFLYPPLWFSWFWYDRGFGLHPGHCGCYVRLWGLFTFSLAGLVIGTRACRSWPTFCGLWFQWQIWVSEPLVHLVYTPRAPMVLLVGQNELSSRVSCLVSQAVGQEIASWAPIPVLVFLAIECLGWPVGSMQRSLPRPRPRPRPPGWEAVSGMGGFISSWLLRLLSSISLVFIVGLKSPIIS